MEPDQEWCLECGAARTIIVRPPDWRIPVIVVGVVLVLLAGGFVYVLTRLGHNAGRVQVTRQAARHPSHSTAAAIASWDPGLDGYTVILASESSESAADRDAKALTAHFPGVGVLDTRQHPDMTGPAQWDVYTGREATYPEAQAAAAQAVHAGQSKARAALVQHPGGG